MQKKVGVYTRQQVTTLSVSVLPLSSVSGASAFFWQQDRLMMSDNPTTILCHRYQQLCQNYNTRRHKLLT